MVQRRFLEVVWSIFCLIRFRPSKCFSKNADKELVSSAISSIYDLYPLYYTRAQLIDKFGSEYKIDQLPADFVGARSESVAKIGDYLVIGEYANDSARIIISTTEFCRIENYYQSISGVRHIHAISKGFSKNTFFVSTGDGNKYLDHWEISYGRLIFASRIKYRLAGYTASIQLNGIKYFGTDFSSRPNYLETLDGEKYFFPLPAYLQYVVALTSIDGRYIVSLNADHAPVGNRSSVNIFDTHTKKYVYCDYFG